MVILETELLLGRSSSVVDSLVGLLLGSILGVLHLLVSSSLGFLYLLVGSILSLFHLLVGSIDSSILDLSGCIAHLFEQTADNSLWLNLGHCTNCSSYSSIVANDGLYLLFVLLQELLNLGHILLGNLRVLLDERGNLLLDSSQGFL